MSNANTNLPLDSGSNTNPTDTTSTSPTDPNAGIAADPNVSAVGQQSATLQLSMAPATSTQPLANPDSSLGSGSSSGTHVGGFVNQSASYRNAIIIASAVSGTIGLILVSFVIWMVYRRRNRRKNGGESTSGGATRPASDSSWVGPRLNPGDSFNDGKLEAGDRGSKADSVESDTTLHGSALTHKKSSSFGTSRTFSPRPSLDKLKITTVPLVSQGPRMAIIPGSNRPSLEQLASQNLLTPLSPRVRRGPALRVESSGNFNSGIVVEQANPSPDIPLVTPVDAWRSPITDVNGNLFTLMPPPARRDSMASLSRQSSRASSRNSPVVDNEATEDTTPRKKAVFFANAKKRRHSRADSIDPFRKSAVSMKVRRKSVRASRTDVLASRGASYSSGGVVRRKSSRSSRASRAEPGSVPSTPGGRRRSRAPSVMSSRSQATVNEPRIFSRPLAPSIRGLPTDPRPPSSLSARRFESASEPFTFPSTSISTPRTAAPPVSRPSTPRTPRTPGGHARRPKASVPRTPTSLEDAHWRAVPLPEPPATATATGYPVTPRPLPIPATPQSASAIALGSRPRTPQSAIVVPPPSRPRTPQTAAVLSRPRTPQSSSNPTQTPPKTPRTARAELRLSQLSRTLSEVSRESGYSNMGKAF
ncbi:hypothetical protein GSI_11573 [Ganoderma sinense ZZ0214-1]|uniref:Uncharacterized protein n=1 Tax=Ganoderma sinense ZZ0214-1 TaxID=1077348 RepID=A0A2G8RWC6_9APHY|nr:hypothetical protein GSI_11573 [Ganoderma sinense ZZ0214-1]